MIAYLQAVSCTNRRLYAAIFSSPVKEILMIDSHLGSFFSFYVLQKMVIFVDYCRTMWYITRRLHLVLSITALGETGKYKNSKKV